MMGEIKSPAPVLLLIAAFADREEPLFRARERVVARFGPITAESETVRFDAFTDYYAASMGPALLKRFWAFRNLIDPSELPAIKRFTNALEDDFAAMCPGGVARPLNLDPGYLDLGKLILASTKDHAHRVYLRDGIFAETTLIYTKKRWSPLPWTYPDYQSEAYHRFFDRCRDFLKDARQVAENAG